MPNQDPKAQQQDYWQAVTDVAEQIVDELQDTDTDEDRDEALHRLLHENTDQHDCVIFNELQVLTLQFSKHPCAALFNGTLLQGNFRPTDSFPFAAFAAEAFEMDVSQKVKELLDAQE